MKLFKNILVLVLLGMGFLIHAQEASVDTSKIYQITEQPPLFPGCVDATPELEKQKQCSSQQLLSFVYQSVAYPVEAVQNEVEGTVVVRFVVEKDGKVGPVEIVKNIGSGCGEATVKAIERMNQLNQPWRPGMQAGEPVRSYVTLPVKFELKELETPKFTMIGQDTIWLEMDQPVRFRGGNEGLLAFVEEKLFYPQQGEANCRIGEIEIQLAVLADSSVWVMDMLDYNNLGIDFLYEAIAAINRSQGQWAAAKRGERPVNSFYNLRLFFSPPGDSCGGRVEEYQRAKTMSAEAAQLFEEGKPDEAIAKWNDAVGLFPDNAEFLSLRGQAFMEAGQLSEACQDLSKAQQVLWVDWYNGILPLICNVPVVKAAEEEK